MSSPQLSIHLPKRGVFSRIISGHSNHSVNSVSNKTTEPKPATMRFNQPTPALNDASFRVRVFIDHPTTEPLYINVVPGVDTLSSIKRKILTEDNHRFLPYRQNRKAPIEIRWNVPASMDEPLPDDHYDFDGHMDIFKVSCSWVQISKVKRAYDQSKVFHSILSLCPSTLVSAGPEQGADKKPLDLSEIFPTPNAELIEARNKGLTELVVRIKPLRTWPLMVSFSDMPSHPCVIDFSKGMKVREVKEIIGQARVLLMNSIGETSAAGLYPSEFLLFKCAQPAKNTSPRIYLKDIDMFRGLTMASIFDDEEADFATHKFMKTFLTKRGNNLLEKVELVAFLIDDMEEDILRSLVVKSKTVFQSNLNASAESYAQTVQEQPQQGGSSSALNLSHSPQQRPNLRQRRSSGSIRSHYSRSPSTEPNDSNRRTSVFNLNSSAESLAPSRRTSVFSLNSVGSSGFDHEESTPTHNWGYFDDVVSFSAALQDTHTEPSYLPDEFDLNPLQISSPNPQKQHSVMDNRLPSPPPSEPLSAEEPDVSPQDVIVEGYTVIAGAMFSIVLRPMDEKGVVVVREDPKKMFNREDSLFSVTPVHVG